MKKQPKRTTRRSSSLFYWILVVLGLAALFSIRYIGKPNGQTGAAATITQGTTIGASHFSDGDTSKGGQGQTVDGISCASTEQLVYHIHAHVSLFDQGKQIAIPRGIGITPPRQVQQNFVTSGKCFYWLHTHDATGIVHIESPVQKTFTLGDFFDIWGEPLGRSGAAGFRGAVKVYVNGKPITGNPRSITLTAHKEITVEVGSPTVTPPQYKFPQGL